MSQHPRIPDIARLSGVSTATVDRVLNKRAGVRSATVQRVMHAATRLGYLPQAEAHAHTDLQTRPLRLVVLIPEGSNRFLQMLGDVIGYAQDHWAPYNVRCHAVYIESFNPEALARALRHHGERCDGIAFMALEHPVVREAVAQLAEQGVPTITLISDLSHSRRVAYVGLDNRAAGRTAGYLVGRFIGPGARAGK
ncbi:MAG: LacI family DNA-binding transcriptional regulator, partial [Haliea sp.]